MTKRELFELVLREIEFISQLDKLEAEMTIRELTRDFMPVIQVVQVSRVTAWFRKTTKFKQVLLSRLSNTKYSTSTLDSLYEFAKRATRVRMKRLAQTI